MVDGTARWALALACGLVAGLALSACGSGEPRRLDAFDLWRAGELRGANVHQRRVYPEIDGTELLGPGPYGAPLRQADFDALAATGANYVQLSVPGIFAERPPYALDQEARRNLDRLVVMAGRADLFAVIAFRTGPGRSEFTFLPDEVGTWFPAPLVDDSAWTAPAARAAWAAMWAETARAYAGNPTVVGYELMVEPNANAAIAGESDPGRFYATHAAGNLDWNAFFPALVTAIRTQDDSTPILLPAMGWSDPAWLPWLAATDDPRAVYVVHDYAPHAYTHQDPAEPLVYPGWIDADGDGRAEFVDRNWIDERLRAARELADARGAPLAVTEYGVARWAPGADQYLADHHATLADLGLSAAVWEWRGGFAPAARLDRFDPWHGPDPDQHVAVASAQADVIRGFWGGDRPRPSDFFGPPGVAGLGR